jgi:60 kDa SS-A/Ro ribonucleoprotein
MRTNTRRTYPPVVTHGGSRAFAHTSALQQLRRSVLACMLWEDTFYEDGQSIADRIREAAKNVSTEDLAQVALEARSEHNLRHVPLLLCVELVKRGSKIAGDTLSLVIQRADEVTEFLSLYWQLNPQVNGQNAPLGKQVKRGLAAALQKFDAYQLAKYDRANAVRLRDVLFLTHAKPLDEGQAATWKQLVEGTLPSPDTWEVALSGGGDKKTEFTRLLTERKLGYLALLRNLRNMVESGVDRRLISDAIIARKGGAERVLPFRYTAAARACPTLEPSIDQALVAAIKEQPAFTGRTAVMVDLSGSMFGTPVSQKSDIDRATAAATLASVINAEDLRVFGFADNVVEVPARRGMAGVDAVLRATKGGTRLFDAIDFINRKVPYDRLIVITDEQDTGGMIRTCPNPIAGSLGYMVNVGTYKNGVGYGAWTHLDGFSEAVLKWMHAFEAEVAQ